MRLVLDAGALIAVERSDRSVTAAIKRQLTDGLVPLTHGGVVGQVWRGAGGRQAVLARALTFVEVRPLDLALGRRAGLLLAQARTSDVIDAAVVLLASDGDWILTSDPGDLRPLVHAAGLHVDVIAV